MTNQIIIRFEGDSIKNYILEQFHHKDDTNQDTFEGEWELGENDDDYELYFYEYVAELNIMRLSKGDNNINKYDMLYKDIQQVFSGFNYSILHEID